MTVLIADDSTISRRLLEAALRKWGYEVLAASDGTEAWRVLQQEDAPRMAILDWMMPGLSGLEVCRHVRSLQKQRYTYILLVTSRNHREDLIEGMEAGADDYITKPFDQNELKVRLGPGRRIVELQDDLEAAQAALREQATVDPLTRLWNRRTTFEILERELARCARGSGPLGVVLADVDHFKAINDTYGHLAGDNVLRESAQRMVASSRQYDAIGRYGGEEFLLILPGCDVETACARAERLRVEIASRPFHLGAACSIHMTCSFGATAVPAGMARGLDQVIAMADQALYEAKKRGRNRVVDLELKETASNAPVMQSHSGPLD